MKNNLLFSSLLVVIGFFISSCDNGKRTTTQIIEKPTISLVVWDETAREGSDGAELQLFQVGTPLSDLTVKFTISGTAKNGYDFNIPEKIQMKNPQISLLVKPTDDFLNIQMRNTATSLIIKPIDDILLEGDETVTITLTPNPAYKIDPDNASKTIVIQDNELPDVQFLLPGSIGPESSQGNVEVTLSKAASNDVKIDYTVSGILAQNSAEDYKVSSGTLTIPAGSTKKTLPLTIINDNIPEDDETIIIEIVKAANANIGLNEKHYYTITNDDGEVPRSSIYDKIYGMILGSRGGSAMGAVVENIGRMEAIEKLYGIFNEFLPYNGNEVFWSHPAGATEDGIERQKCISTAIIEKQDRIKAEDLVRVWVRDCDMEKMYYMTQPYDRTLLAYSKWGIPIAELPKTKFGMPSDLGEHIHLTARVFHPIAAINAGDPEGAIEDTKEVGRVFFENKNDDAFAWGGVYNAALSLAMLPDASVNSVIEGALKFATPEIKAEIEFGLAIANRYTDPMDRRFRVELNAMYADSASPYFINKRIMKYMASSVYENVTCSFAILKLTKGNVEQAVMVANNRGRDTDCTAASAGGLAGALTGTTTIPKKWIDQLEIGTMCNPYTNSRMTNKATAQGLYRALQSKLKRMSEELKAAEKQHGTDLPVDFINKKKYLKLIHEIGAK